MKRSKPSLEISQKLRSIPLRQRLSIGMGIMLLPLLGLGISALVSFERGLNSFETSDNRTLEELFPVKELEVLIGDAERAFEGCILEKVSEECSRYGQLSQQIQERYNEVLSTSSGLSEKQALVQRSYDIWRDLQPQVIVLQAQSQTQFTTESRRRLVYQWLEDSQKAAAALDRIQNTLIHFQISDTLDLVRQVKQEVRLGVFGVFGFSLGMAAIAGWLLARSILRPIYILQSGVNHLSEGQLSYRIELDNQDEFGQLAGLFNQMAEALEQNQTELVNLATLDGLTGVYNRREFTKRLQNELLRSQRYQRECSLMMFDIDFFKKLNDTYGHQVGDEALKQVAALLRREVRPSDQVARYGGEEFAVIMPETEIQAAVAVAERLRQHLMRMPIAIAHQKPIHVTASIGVATFPYHAQAGETLLSAADQALYTAKHQGRNQVVRFDRIDMFHDSSTDMGDLTDTGVQGATP